MSWLEEPQMADHLKRIKQNYSIIEIGRREGINEVINTLDTILKEEQTPEDVWQRVSNLVKAMKESE